MVESGARLEWESKTSDAKEPYMLVDKHSSGGVGDKVSLILAPLVACLGMRVPMMAGRGLGHTGGTIDKLESIPGYNTKLDIPTFQKIVLGDVGCAIVSPTTQVCPADRKIYALRDVTCTVSSIPLATASIMSKKIAENPDSLVLDCKFGRAAFFERVGQAEELAHSLIATGEGNGVKTTAFLTRVDHPIGRAIGNWLEVYECIQMMKTGTGPFDLLTLVVMQAAQMIQPKYPDLSWEERIDKTLKMLQSGQVYTKFRDMVEAQGGEVAVCDACAINQAKFTHDILSPADGFVVDMNALEMGLASVKLGAGRSKAEDAVDPAAGIYLHATVGEAVKQGAVVATLYTNISEAVLESATQMVQDAIQYADAPVEVPNIVSHRVFPGGKIEEMSLPDQLKNLA